MRARKCGTIRYQGNEGMEHRRKLACRKTSDLYPRQNMSK
ncbi:hypothetical protein COPCOM_00412 [Coprococcus comes ATCC 27758]|uniref:Uncharacterized protein n=1 Tax=Coprococcus comes ATCC 27758 TaxID=470146 RepID=C0B5J1_9FIRM|nr:hypothetical protein COPCOM_00412 [Coprococcus comes ATCC 27758]